MATEINKHNIFAVFVVSFGAFIMVFNQTTINPALPLIMEEFSISPITAQWLFSGYTLALAIMIPLNSYLLEKFSVNTICKFTIILYIIGCLWSWLSVSFWQVLVGRIFQGISNGIILPTATAITFYLIPEKYRGRAFGITGLIFCLAPLVGPIFSAFISAYFNWRIIFFAVGVLDVFCFILIFIMKKIDIGREHNINLDWWSLILSTIGFFVLVYGLTVEHDNFVLSCIMVLFGAVLIVLFFRRQVKIDNPILELGILKNKKYLISVITVVVTHGCLLGTIVIFPLLIQNVMGYSVIIFALSLIPSSIVSDITVFVSGWIFDKRGIRFVSIFGFLVLIISSLMFVFVRPESSLVFVIIAMCVRTFGSGFVSMNINVWGINALKEKEIKDGNTFSNSMRQVFVALCTALNASIFVWMGSGIDGITMVFTLQGILFVACLIVSIIMLK